MPRPSWKKHARQNVALKQDGKCAWCDKPLNRVYQVHHDYKGHKWADVNEIIESDDLKALGFDKDSIKALRKQMYHDANSLYAMHPDCHIKADKAQLEGRLLTEERKRW